MNTSASICPVPFEQQPINEYQDLKESCFFRWATLELQTYFKRLTWLWLWGWLIAGPVAAASFSWAKYPGQLILSGAAGATLFLALVLLRVYLGWNYIRSRLANETIFYEESGWYDGQYWSKPPEMLTRDRLLVTYEVQPILKRLRHTFAVLACCFLGGGLVWICL